jgi:FixJ family two-component response regulator
VSVVLSIYFFDSYFNPLVHSLTLPGDMAHILIVDDNETFLYAARELLMRQRRGFLVDTAADAEQALLAIRRLNYDVVVSDIRLPGLQGLELLEECRRIRPETPVVLITGYGDRELEEEAARRGAYAFLHKPVAAEAFCSVVDRAALQTSLRRNHEDALGADSLWYTQAAEQIRRRSETIVQDLRQALTRDDDEMDMLTTWADQEADRIISMFLDYEGSDDLIRLQGLISRALCVAYETGKTRQSTLGGPLSRKKEIHPDTSP